MTNKSEILTTIATSSSIGFATVFAMTEDMQKALGILTVLIIVDFFSGVIKSWIHKETNSDAMSRGVVRKGVLVLIPLTIIVAGNGVGINLQTLATWMLSALIFSEGYSIIANVYEINTGKRAKEYDVMSIIIGKIGGVLDGFLKTK